MKKIMLQIEKSIPVQRKLHGLGLIQCRNAAQCLGGKESWKKRNAAELFGEGVMLAALAMAPAQLELIKNMLIANFEAQFTELEFAQEEAGRKAAEAFRRGEDIVGPEDCDLN